MGLVALGFLALKVGNLSGSTGGETYLVQAKFDNIGGLKVRAAVKSAGVVVGRVSEIRFDPENYVAVVSMQVDTRYQFPKDTFHDQYVRFAGRAVRRFRRRRRYADAQVRRPYQENPVGSGA